MKTAMSVVAAFALLLGLGLMNQANAQIITPVDLHAPFSFIVDGTKLPAGDYVIKPMDDVEAGDNVMEIDSVDGRHAVAFITVASHLDNEPEYTQVWFNNYNGRRYLSRVYVAGDKDGVSLEPGYWEKREIKKGITPKVEHHKAKKH